MGNLLIFNSISLLAILLTSILTSISCSMSTIDDAPQVSDEFAMAPIYDGGVPCGVPNAPANCGCQEGHYAFNSVCLLTVPGKTYFVSLTGDDTNPGTFEQPFYRWQKGATVARPGDIVYIRGGVWMPTTRGPEGDGRNWGLIISGPKQYNTAASGTAAAPIRYWNYPGERPVLDGSLMTTDQHRWNMGIDISDVEYIYMKGLTVRHVHQSPPDPTHAKIYSSAHGISSGGANHRFENMVSHDIDGRGFQHWSYAWNSWDAEYGYQLCLRNSGGDASQCDYPTIDFKSDNTTWTNCDAYNLYDRYSEEPGNAADGWKVGTYYGNTFSWEGCRAWNYSDDGFDPHGSGTRIFNQCWAMPSNKYPGEDNTWKTERNGFKMTGVNGTNPIGPANPNYVYGRDHYVQVANSIAAIGSGAGIVNNITVNFEVEWPNGGLLYNNFAYKMGTGFRDNKKSTLNNNVSYGSSAIGPIGDHQESQIYTVDYTANNNSWVPYTTGGSYPWSLPNPAYTVSDEDYVSLDVNELTRQRKADYSLPDINFAHLARGSDLIDAGIVVPGYHCATAGAHPSEDCVVWYGNAPDVGPFESNY